VRLRFVHEGRLRERVAHGPLRLLFRYDLSPMFPRLHNPLKSIGVLDHETGELRFVDAPRTYRMPVRLSFSSRDIERSVSAVVLMDKFGLRRIAPLAASAVLADSTVRDLSDGSDLAGAAIT
jgi:hypothetical protein